MKNYRSAIITGASSGIGAAIASQLCERGVKVYALARNKTRLQTVKAALSKAGQQNFTAIVCDITNREQVDKTVDNLLAADPVDLLVNNAGVGFSRHFLEQKATHIDQTIATNLYGTIAMTQAVLRHRDKKRHLHIVMVTSLAGKMGFPELSIYSATKFALEGLTETLRLEYANEPVTFTVLRPGITDTSFFDKAGMQLYKDSVKELDSYFTPQKVATVFLQQLPKRKAVITVGNDKFFVPILPFIPFKSRFKVLDIINKL